MIFRNALLILLSTFLLVCTAAADTPCEQQKLKVLFEVGGAAFHDPVHLPKMLKGILEDTGDFEVTITEDRDQFKAQNINNYDLVLIYTTGGELTKEQEQGIVSFVENGKGLVGIHSATDSFKNSDAYWKLVGGRFTGHGSGTFKVKITGKRHVTVKNMQGFEITDETYRHKFHPESDLVVLMRREMDGDPVTWVQYYGEGRVFVTGLGHDAKAWENPAFQEMVINGLLWANGRLNP